LVHPSSPPDTLFAKIGVFSGPTDWLWLDMMNPIRDVGKWRWSAKLKRFRMILTTKHTNDTKERLKNRRRRFGRFTI